MNNKLLLIIAIVALSIAQCAAAAQKGKDKMNAINVKAMQLAPATGDMEQDLRSLLTAVKAVNEAVEWKEKKSDEYCDYYAGAIDDGKDKWLKQLLEAQSCQVPASEVTLEGMGELAAPTGNIEQDAIAYTLMAQKVATAFELVQQAVAELAEKSETMSEADQLKLQDVYERLSQEIGVEF